MASNASLMGSNSFHANNNNQEQSIRLLSGNLSQLIENSKIKFNEIKNKNDNKDIINDIMIYDFK